MLSIVMDTMAKEYNEYKETADKLFYKYMSNRDESVRDEYTDNVRKGLYLRDMLWDAQDRVLHGKDVTIEWVNNRKNIAKEIGIVF